MTKYLLIAVVGMSVMTGCLSKVDPYDQVRGWRRSYDITYEFTVSNESEEMTYQVNVQNNSGGLNLQELTLDAVAFDAQMNELWKKRFEFDVTGVGNYASEEKIFKQKIAGAANIDSLSIKLAPDNAGSGFESYSEFMRVKN